MLKIMVVIISSSFSHWETKSERIALWDIVLHKVSSGPVSNGALDVYLGLAGPTVYMAIHQVWTQRWTSKSNGAIWDKGSVPYCTFYQNVVDYPVITSHKLTTFANHCRNSMHNMVVCNSEHSHGFETQF